MTVAYVCVAVLLVLSLAAVRHGRPAISVPTVILVLATAGWNLTRVFRGPDDSEPSVIVALSILMVQIGVASLFVLTRRLVYGRWRGPTWMWIAMVWFATAVFVGMLPAMGIVTGPDYRTSPVFLAHLIYTFGLLGVAILTLNLRQYDQSRHVRRYIVGTEAAALLTVTFQVVIPGITSIAAAAMALLAVWTTSHPGAWSRSASRADRLLDSIGVFIFVIDREGMLRDWNGPAASLLELTGTHAKRGMNLATTLGIAPTFVDGQTVRLELQHGGSLRTALSVHAVDPLARHGDRVLMFRPVRSSVESSSFPVVSGELQGHDPATQTLGRKAAIEMLQRSAEDGTAILRFEMTSRADRRPDEVMFLLARRLEARSAEEGWPDVALARLDTWTFVTTMVEVDRIVARRARYDDIDVEINISVHRRSPSESVAAFSRRVEEDLQDGTSTAHGT